MPSTPPLLKGLAPRCNPYGGAEMQHVVLEPSMNERPSQRLRSTLRDAAQGSDEAAEHPAPRLVRADA